MGVGGWRLIIESGWGSACFGRTIRSVAGTIRRGRHKNRPIGSATRSPTVRPPTFPPILGVFDSVILPHRLFLEALQPLAEALRGPDYQAQFQQAMSEEINHIGAAS